MSCSRCAHSVYKDVLNFICAIEAHSVYLGGCTSDFLSKFSVDLPSKKFSVRDTEKVDLAVFFGLSVPTEKVQTILEKARLVSDNVLIYLYVGDCEREVQGRNSDFWINFIKNLFGNAYFMGIIGSGFVISSVKGIKWGTDQSAS